MEGGSLPGVPVGGAREGCLDLEGNEAVSLPAPWVGVWEGVGVVGE
jgi:hypothetical protein